MKCGIIICGLISMVVLTSCSGREPLKGLLGETLGCKLRARILPSPAFREVSYCGQKFKYGYVDPVDPIPSILHGERCGGGNCVCIDAKSNVVYISHTQIISHTPKNFNYLILDGILDDVRKRYGKPNVSDANVEQNSRFMYGFYFINGNECMYSYRDTDDTNAVGWRPGDITFRREFTMVCCSLEMSALMAAEDVVGKYRSGKMTVDQVRERLKGNADYPDEYNSAFKKNIMRVLKLEENAK